jgi:hypothetical protein
MRSSALLIDRACRAELTSQSQVIGAQKEAERSEIAERDDRTAIRINEMNEPTGGADQPNKHRQAEEAILAAIEKGVPLSLACCRAGVSYEFFFQWRKDNPEFQTAVARARRRTVAQSVKSTRAVSALSESESSRELKRARFEQ